MITLYKLAAFLLLSGYAVADVLSSGASPSGEAFTKDRAMAVLERHVSITGGELAFEALHNLRIKFRISEPGFVAIGDYRATRDGWMRVDIFIDGDRVFSEGIDGGGPWQQGGEGAEITGMTEVAANRLRRGVVDRFTSLASQAAEAGGARWAGEVTIAGTVYETVEVVGSDGHSRFYFANKETGLIKRMREVEALHPDLDPTVQLEEEITLEFAKYCGLLGARLDRTVNLATGEEIQETEVLTKECNLPEAELNIERP